MRRLLLVTVVASICAIGGAVILKAKDNGTVPHTSSDCRWPRRLPSRLTGSL